MARPPHDRHQTSTDRWDSDGDGLSDAQEDRNLNGVVDDCETDPCDADTDGDDRDDSIDAFPLDKTEWLDTDKDGVGNNSDPDVDGDGLENGIDQDDDNDGFTDEDEFEWGFDPLDLDSRPLTPALNPGINLLLMQ